MPGPVTPDERKLMQQNVQIGFDLVKAIPFLTSTTEAQMRSRHNV
jgi:hypothetical protein